MVIKEIITNFRYPHILVVDYLKVWYTSIMQSLNVKCLMSVSFGNVYQAFRLADLTRF